MKQFIAFIALFSLTSCFAKDPKFHFKDCIKFNSGFYSGCSGIVEEYADGSYRVKLYGCQGDDFFVDASHESRMELFAGCKNENR